MLTLDLLEALLVETADLGVLLHELLQAAVEGVGDAWAVLMEVIAAVVRPCPGA